MDRTEIANRLNVTLDEGVHEFVAELRARIDAIGIAHFAHIKELEELNGAPDAVTFISVQKILLVMGVKLTIVPI